MALSQNVKQFEWQWSIPKFFNIGEACTDWVCEDGKKEHIAMIVEDNAKGTSSITFKDLTSFSFG